MGSTATGVVRFALLILLAVGSLNGRAVMAQDSPFQGALLDRELFLLTNDERPLALAHGGIVPESLALRVGGETWLVGRDFRLRARGGIILPLRPWCDAGTVVAVVDYHYQPGLPSGRIGLRPVTPAPAEDAQGVPLVVEEVPEWSLDDVGNLEVRGSKSVYVSSGSRRDMTVDQNLRLNVSGRLTNDIFVRAMLTDDNLPVVPEGNTEELQDIDKVLVEIQAPNWDATLGDFVARREGTLFGNYRRKLQGFSLNARPGPARVEALFGSPRGLYRTMELQGEESNQGPYFLGSGEAGQNLFIVAGSERVTLDGETLTRGSDKDYVVDYVRGTVTFTYRRLITAESLIVVEFEEGEGPYSRAVVGGGGGAVFNLFSLPGSLGVRLIKESDDAGRLRSGELSPEDEAIIEAAGDDPLASVAPGATEVLEGEGDYIQLTDGEVTYYEFAEEGGNWSLIFFYAGLGLGDYDLTSLTEAGTRVYEYMGEDQGSYLIGRQLPLPESQSLMTMHADLGDSMGVGLHAEWHLSEYDKNILSDLDDGDNGGQAAHVLLRSGDVGALGGNLRANAAWEHRDDRFAPFLVHKTIYDYESWGLGDRARREGFLDERDSELDADLAWLVGTPGKLLELSGSLARLEHGIDLEARRQEAKGRWEWLGGRGRHSWREASSTDKIDPLDITRSDQAHDLRWQLGPIVPRVGFQRQSWQDDVITGDAAHGYGNDQLTVGISSPGGSPWRYDLGFTRGLVDSLREQTWDLERDSRTWSGSITTPRFVGLRVLADATVREVLQPNSTDETTRLGRLELGGNWPKLGSDWSLGYSLDNSRTEVLARQLVYVGTLQGSYDENGNFVGIGRGDYDLVLAGTDSLVATTAVMTDFSWRQDFAFLGENKVWGSWISQTRVGVEARSRTDDIKGLLLLQKDVIFSDEDAVLGRVDLTEDITFLRHLRSWDLRYRLDFIESMDRQFAQGREDRLKRQHTGTLTWNPTAKVSLRLRGSHDDDRRDTDAEYNPTQLGYHTLIQRGELEWSWRPVSGSRVALGMEYIQREDEVSTVQQQETALVPNLRWRLAEAWSLQGDLRLSSVNSENSSGARAPFFFPPAGTNMESNARLSWDPSRYLTFALAWFGRKLGDLDWQHDLRLESTARF